MALAKPKAMWPIVIVAGVNDRIDFKIGATPYVATISPATYDHLRFYAGQTGPALLAAVDTALIAAASGSGWSPNTVMAGNKVKLQGTSAFSLQWDTGPNKARSIGPTLGFDVVDQAAATTQTAQSQHVNAWYADDPPEDDSGNLPAYDRAVARAQGGQTRAVDFGTTYDRVLSLSFLQPWKVFREEEGTTHVNEALERLFDSGWAKFRWWPDASVEEASTDYVLSPDTAKALPRSRLSPGNSLYSLQLRLWKWIA
jgi:hypothetical protein